MVLHVKIKYQNQTTRKHGISLSKTNIPYFQPKLEGNSPSKPTRKL
jgi:hypothetical protein